MKVIRKIKSVMTDYLFSLSDKLIDRSKLFYHYYKIVQEATWLITKIYVHSVLRYYERISKR